jgi:SAM-dependent methyltransferase
VTTTDPYGDAANAELYDLAWGDQSGDLQMYEQFARRGELPCLELGVGTGRVALHLARQGLHVVGIDASAPMLARLEASLDHEAAQHLRLIEADMRDFDLTPQQFDLVYCAGNSFQHMLTTDDQFAALRCVARHLARGAVYVMQLRALRAIDWAVERAPLYLRWTRPIGGSDDRLMRFDSTTTAAAAQTATTTHFFDRVSPDGSVSRRIIEYTLRYTGLPELRSLHDASGLRITNVYADTDLSPYDDDSDTMIVVAEAKET